MDEADTRQQAAAHRYPNVVRFVRETPWAILEQSLDEIRQMLAMHARGYKFTDEEIAARVGSGPSRRIAYQTAGSVAVIPIYGVITPRADLMTEMSGGTSIDRLQQSVRQAVADEKVKSILLDVNSPGGSVAMLSEMASEIRQARRQKPVVAVANTTAASAAYHLASQASELYATPSGSVGSIGTIATHDDISAALEAEGVKTTVISAGKYKGELNPYQPLSDEAKAELQSMVDKYYAMFVQDVARGRGITVEAVRADYGQGRMLLARDALAAGMIDGVRSFDETLARMEKTGSGVAPSALRAEADDPPEVADTDTQNLEAAHSGLSFVDEADAAAEALEAVVARVTSLAEVKRGSLTASKREQVTACRDRASEAAAALTDVLEATAPVNHGEAAAGEFAAWSASPYTKGQ